MSTLSDILETVATIAVIYGPSPDFDSVFGDGSRHYVEGMHAKLKEGTLIPKPGTEAARLLAFIEKTNEKYKNREEAIAADLHRIFGVYVIFPKSGEGYDQSKWTRPNYGGPTFYFMAANREHCQYLYKEMMAGTRYRGCDTIIQAVPLDQAIYFFDGDELGATFCTPSELKDFDCRCGFAGWFWPEVANRRGFCSPWPREQSYHGLSSLLPTPEARQ